MYGAQLPMTIVRIPYISDGYVKNSHTANRIAGHAYLPTYIYMPIHIYTYTYLHTHVYTYTYIHTPIHTQILIYTYIYIHICIYIYTNI